MVQFFIITSKAEGTAGAMAYSVKLRLGKYEDLNSIPTTEVKEPDMVAHACNTSLGEVEEERSLRLAYWPSILA